MRKMFLTLALLFITTFGFAQTVQWYQATSFASKPYNAPSWSEWQSSSVKICFNVAEDVIIIYSPTIQYYRVINQVQAPYDSDGVQVKFYVRNSLGQTCYVRLRMENNGNS